jgi:hypothetical protein
METNIDDMSTTGTVDTVDTAISTAAQIAFEALRHLAEPVHKDLIALVREMVLRPGPKLKFDVYECQLERRMLRVVYTDNDTSYILFDKPLYDRMIVDDKKQLILSSIDNLINNIEKCIIKPAVMHMDPNRYPGFSDSINMNIDASYMVFRIHYKITDDLRWDGGPLAFTMNDHYYTSDRGCIITKMSPVDVINALREFAATIESISV